MTLIFVLLAIALIYIAYKYPKQTFIIGLLILPFHAAIVTFLKSFLGLGNVSYVILTLWKEFILFGILANIAISRINNKEKLKFEFIDYLIVLFGVLAILVSLINHIDLKTFIYGIRYDFEIFAVFYVARNLKFNKEEIISFFKRSFPVVVAVALFAIIQHFLPNDFLKHLGYQTGEWTPGSVSAFQLIGDTQILRSQSFFSGPNQLGLFLTSAFIFYLSQYGLFKKELNSKLLIGLLLLVLIALVFTFSRSAWIILIAGIILIAFNHFKKYWLNITIFIAMFVVLLIPLFFSNNIVSENKIINNYVLHQGSTQERIDRFNSNLDIFKRNPFGLGAGTSGLAAFTLDSSNKNIIPENWFLQIGVEYGYVGLILYILIIASLIYKTTKSKNQFAFSGFLIIAITSIYSLFLPIWTDAPSNFWIWLMIGLIYIQIPNNQPNENIKCSN